MVLARHKYDTSQLGAEIESYLKLKSGPTGSSYQSGFIKFLEYYRKKHGPDKSMTDFLDAVFENFKKPLREQTPRLIETEFVDFVNYLKELNISSNSIRVYIAALQNFLKFYNISVSIGFIGNMPQPVAMQQNGKHEWKIEQIKQYVDAANNYRDKALILCLFQSGLGINEVLMLNYGDIKEELEKDVMPIHLKLRRKKTGVEFRTFLGRDAIKYLKLYLATRGSLNKDSPLFTLGVSDTKRLTDAATEMKFREIAPKLDFINMDNFENGYNPARPHSLRAAFSSRLTGKIDRVLIEFWMGHEIGEEKRAYLNMPLEEMRELYMDAERYLAIEKTSRDELANKQGPEAAIPKEALEEIAELKTTLQGLSKQYTEGQAENLELKSRVSRAELATTELQKRMQKIEEYIDEFKKELGS